MRLRHTPNTFFCVKATLNNGSRYCQVLMKFRLRENGKLSFTKNEPFQLRVILLFQLFRATNLLAITIYPKNPPMLTYRYYKLFIFLFFLLILLPFFNLLFLERGDQGAFYAATNTNTSPCFYVSAIHPRPWYPA